MTDLPTRLRTRADLHDHLTAGLMRAAADEIKRLRAELEALSPASSPIVKTGEGA